MEESWLSALCGQPNEFGWYEGLWTAFLGQSSSRATFLVRFFVVEKMDERLFNAPMLKPTSNTQTKALTA